MELGTKDQSHEMGGGSFFTPYLIKTDDINLKLMEFLFGEYSFAYLLASRARMSVRIESRR